MRNATNKGVPITNENSYTYVFHAYVNLGEVEIESNITMINKTIFPLQ